MEGGGERERGRERERMRKQVRASFPIMNIKLEIKPYSVLNVPPLFLLFLPCRKELIYETSGSFIKICLWTLIFPPTISKKLKRISHQLFLSWVTVCD